MSYSQYSLLEISYRLKRNYDSLSKRVLIFLDNILLRYTKCMSKMKIYYFDVISILSPVMLDK